MLHSGQSFPGTPALPGSTTGTGPGEEAHKWNVFILQLFHVLIIFSYTLFKYLLTNCILLHHWSYFVRLFTFPCYILLFILGLSVD